MDLSLAAAAAAAAREGEGRAAAAADNAAAASRRPPPQHLRTSMMGIIQCGFLYSAYVWAKAMRGSKHMQGPKQFVTLQVTNCFAFFQLCIRMCAHLIDPYTQCVQLNQSIPSGRRN
jgi:hypothetical protein